MAAIKVEKGVKMPNVFPVSYQTGGEIIKRVRCENYLNREQMRKKMGVSLDTLQKMEDGKRPISFELLSDTIQDFGFEVVIRRKM